ncbi:hypothetical protein, partial [Agrobacterium pusense]|uniref:hypothetical protein n=1 Tax=Agrobacterium pusense TaxID=648995 RepID=UPI001F3BF817
AMGGFPRFNGLEGSYTRWTRKRKWKRTPMDSGLQITPILAARGDALWTDMTAGKLHPAAHPML